MSRCKTCKHWEDPDANWIKVMGFGRCVRAEAYNGLPDDKATLAFAEDVEQHRAYLRTSPDFGCLMYEPKPEAT